MKPRIIIHGEVNFIEQTKDLKNLKKLDIQNDYYVVGESEIHGLQHIDRGYELFETKFANLGANIVRYNDESDLSDSSVTNVKENINASI